jgi:hypothetical protein
MVGYAAVGATIIYLALSGRLNDRWAAGLLGVLAMCGTAAGLLMKRSRGRPEEPKSGASS